MLACIPGLDNGSAQEIVGGTPEVATGLVDGGQGGVGLSAVRLQLHHAQTQLLAAVEVAHRELQVGLAHDSLRVRVEVAFGFAADLQST